MSTGLALRSSKKNTEDTFEEEEEEESLSRESISSFEQEITGEESTRIAAERQAAGLRIASFIHSH
jgi:hypothetical protein